MKRTIRELAAQLHCQVLGDDSASITHVSSLQSAKSDSLVFVDDSRHLDAALASRAAAVITGAFVSAASGKSILVSDQPRLTFARAAKLLIPSSDQPHGIHPTAIVPMPIHLGKDVSVGPRAVLGKFVHVAAGSDIGAGCIIGDDVEIGSYCRIDANVTIYSGTTIGNRVVIQAGSVLGSEGFGYVRDRETGRYEQFPQVGRLVIEDDVEIGANATIDRGALDDTRIRRGTKIDNLVHVGHNVQVGQDVVIAAQTGLSGSAAIEDNVIIGGQVGIADHVRIEEGAILGAQSGIPSKKVIRGKGIVFWGTPARPIKEYLRELAFLSRAARKSSSE